jgi:hypothetical protein
MRSLSNSPSEVCGQANQALTAKEGDKASVAQEAPKRGRDKNESIARSVGFADKHPFSFRVGAVGAHEGVWGELPVALGTWCSAEALALALSPLDQPLCEQQAPAPQHVGFVCLLQCALEASIIRVSNIDGRAHGNLAGLYRPQ